MPNKLWQDVIASALQQRAAGNSVRQRRALRVIDATHVELDGRQLVNFASNNYLGLTHHPRVISAFESAARQYGVGSGAAALVSGYTDVHESAERAIAAWKQSESSVLLGSGYSANLAAVQTIAAVAGARPARFLLDRLVHASLIDAVRGSGADFRVFPHNGMDKLARLLAGASPDQLQVVVSESIFSMDSDAADLAGLAELKLRHPFLLLLDEAHGSGVYGPAGAGFAAEGSLQGIVDVSIVTLSKAIGVYGGAVCASRDFCEALVNFGRPFIYSTHLPPAVAAAVEAAIAVMRDEPQLQQRVRALARDVRRRLLEMGFTLPAGDSPIVPIILGGESETLAAAQSLREAGCLAVAIRPPTVPRGASRLRVTLSSEHRAEEVEELLEALGRIQSREKVPDNRKG